MATPGKENIGWFDIAVNDALGMGCIKGISDLFTDVEKLLGVERIAVQEVFESGAFQIFHGNEGPASVVADFVDGANIRMVQRRRSAGFPAETFQSFRVLG